ncbi:MAG: Ig-like domain-containing protein [Clostridia bacterium]|nr:Ig-like domain-containing protein [Clostridia bacterium]
MKLIEILKMGQESAFPNRERILKKVLNRKKKMVALWIMAAILAVGIGSAAVAIGFLSSHRPQKEIIVGGAMNIIESIEGKDGSMMNFPMDSSLLIKTNEDVSAKEMKARIKLEPEGEFSVRRMGDCRYSISFEDLSENTLYNLAAVYNGTVVYRWAFQTKNPFSIVNTAPAGEGKVSVNSPIEVTFSHSDVLGFEDAFSISPKVEGSFEQYGRTWGFIPSAPLEESTLYTVTLAPSLKGPEGATIDKEYSFTFKTEDGSAYAYLLYRDIDLSDTFLVNEQPVAAVAYENINVSSAKVQVYALKDSERYINAYKKYVKSGTVSDGIMELADQKQLEFESTPVLVDDYQDIPHAAFINYPEALPQGYYFAKIELGGKILYQLLQSTDLSVYALTANGDHVIWVNDGSSGTPLSGVRLNLEGFPSTKTSSKGLAILKNTADTLDKRFLVVENGDFPYVAVLNGGKTDSKIEKQNHYYTYLTTDSALYRSGETIGIFGAVLPRIQGVGRAEDLSIEASFLEEPIPLKLDQNGAFTAKIMLPATIQSNGEIKLMMGSTHIDSAYFSIGSQDSSPYRLLLSTDRKAYKAGEFITFHAQLTHSDGTPAAGISLSNGEGISGVTDENGNFSSTLVVEPDKNVGNYSVRRLFLKADNTDVFADVAYLVFSNECIIESEYNNGKLSVALFEANLNAPEKWSEDALLRETFDPSLLKGKAITGEISAELHEVSYSKEAMGSTYDASNKKAETVYRYKEQDTILRRMDLLCNEGIISLDIDEKSNTEKKYYVNLYKKGSDQIMNQIFLGQQMNFDRINESTYDIFIEQDEYRMDENVVLRVRDNRDRVLVNSGCVVYIVVSGGVLDVYQSDSPIVTFPFKMDYAPQIVVFGAYFDGKHIYSLGRESLSYHHMDSSLKIEVESDQEQYKAGEKPVLNFKVSDQEGNPVEATLNVSLMDRDLYLANHNATDPIHDFYAYSPYYDFAYTMESHRDFREIKQEYLHEDWDGFSVVNCNYEPSPYFETVSTNSQGEASVTFELPDSLTHWKVVARAVSAEAQGGIHFYDLPTTQGFYTNVVVSENLKSSEDCMIALRAEGSYLAEGASCYFKVGITDRDGAEIKTLEATSKKGNYATLNFGKLSAGLYTAYIHAGSGNFTYSVIKSFQVGGNNDVIRIQGFYASDGSDLMLSPVKGDVTLTITDENFGFWLEALSHLAESKGERIDQILSSALIRKMHENGSWSDKEGLDVSAISSFMGMDGIKLKKDAEHGDLRLSAAFAAVAPEFCDADILSDYFEQYLNNRYASQTDRIIACFGLSALRKPVLSDLQSFYKNGSDFSTEEWSYLALGFAYGGDYTTAEYIANQHIKAYLSGDDELRYISVDGEVQDELSGAFSILCGRLSLNYSEGVLRFLMKNDKDNPLLNFGLIAYLNDYVPNISGENKIALSTSDGRVANYRYQKYRPLIFNIDQKSAEKIRISDVEGNSSIHYLYYGEGISS